MISIDRLDHLVLTVRDIQATCDFYQRVLSMEPYTFGEGRTALRFGRQKINLHPYPPEIGLVADTPTPGSADLCFITSTPISAVVSHLHSQNIPIISGPLIRSGANGPILSVYFRDPDQNLIEVSNEVTEAEAAQITQSGWQP